MEQKLISTFEYPKKINTNGYISIFIDNQWIYEHRYIIQFHIGRELNKGEVIHHINGLKQDNRISNLMLFKSNNEHKNFEDEVKKFGWTKHLVSKVNKRWEEFFKDER